MQATVNSLWKQSDTMVLGWKPDSSIDPADIKNYKIYVGLANLSTALVLLGDNINPQVSELPAHRGNVVYQATIADVRSVLSLPTTINFTNVLLYYAVTYVNHSGVESTLANSTISESLPAGIEPKQRKDDPTAYRQIFGFNDNDYRWVKLAASNNGGVAVDSADFYRINTITEYTYTGGGDVSTAKSYLSDRTWAGSPAKLIINEYSGSNLIKTTVMDSTV